MLGVAVVAMGASAGSASAANDVWLWSCHGPSGEALGNAGFETFDAFGGGGCDATSADLSAGARLTGKDGSASFSIPPNAQVDAVRLQRRATLPAGATYTATAGAGNVIDSAAADAAAEDKTITLAPAATSSSSLVLGLACGTVCAGATLDVGHVAMKVSETGTADAQKPAFAVGGWNSPARDKLTLDVRASDAGLGLRWAQASFEGGTVAAPVAFDANCRDLTPSDATVDLPLKNSCPNVGSASLTVDTKELADGPGKRLVVSVTDVAGNVSTQVLDTEILNNINLGTNTQTLNIGTSGTTTPAATNPAGTTPSGGVAGSSAQNCKTPRLSFSLSQKPMRVSKGVPVLQSGKRYRFNGRLTCVINGKRKSAPKRARVDIFNKIGKKTYTKAGVTVRDAGKLTVILAYKTSRTITFRFTNSDGKRSQVSIKVKVEKKKKSKR